MVEGRNPQNCSQTFTHAQWHTQRPLCVGVLTLSPYRNLFPNCTWLAQVSGWAFWDTEINHDAIQTGEVALRTLTASEDDFKRGQESGGGRTELEK